MAKQGREKIITAAFSLFLNKGYKKTSLNDIIIATNSSKGAIYHHFKSKHAIYLAALDEYFFKLYDTLFINDFESSFSERIKSRYLFFVDLIDFVEKSGKGTNFPIRRYFLFQLESEENSEIRERITHTLEAYRNNIQEIIQQAINSKEIKAQLSSQVIAMQLMSMIEGIAIHHSTLETNSKPFLIQQYERVVLPYINLLTL